MTSLIQKQTPTGKFIVCISCLAFVVSVLSYML